MYLPGISIVIPVYNSQKFLSKCISSVLSQDFDNLEIILINDTSTDKSLEISRRFKEYDKRIKIIDNQSNLGVEKNRLMGLRVAQTEYVFFIDSDDWLDNKYVLSSLYKKAKETNADYVEIGCQRVINSHKWFKSSFNSSHPLIISQPQLFQDYFISFFGVNKLSVNIWGKLYRKTTLDKANIKQFGVNMGEDLGFNLQLFPHLNKIVLLNQPGYNYRIGGMTSRYNPHFLKDMKKLFYIKEEMIEKHNYKKAIPFTRYELKNVLKSEICQTITYKKGTKTDIIQKISTEINDPIYQHLYEMDPSANFWNSPFVIAFKNKDAKQLFEICNKEVLKQTPKRILKNMAFKILNAFN